MTLKEITTYADEIHNVKKLNRIIADIIVSDFLNSEHPAFCMIQCKTRKREVFFVRASLSWVFKKALQLSLADIAAALNMADHTSVMHPLEVHKDQYGQFDQYTKTYDEVLGYLEGKWDKILEQAEYVAGRQKDHKTMIERKRLERKKIRIAQEKIKSAQKEIKQVKTEVRRSPAQHKYVQEVLSGG